MFETVGELARWRMVYPVLRETPPDTLVDYDALSEILGEADRRIIQHAVRRAGKELLRADNRAVEAVPTKGYRIVTAVEHLRLSKKQKLRAGRAAGRGKDLVTHVDLNLVPTDLHKSFRDQQEVLGKLVEIARRNDAKVRRLEAQVEAIMPKVDGILDRLGRAGFPE